MIQANELRIGNYFLESYEGYKIIAGINHHNDLPMTVDAHAIGRNICGRYDLDAMQPILLTEDILLKCGFEYDFISYNLHFGIDWHNGVLRFSQGKGKTIFLPCTHLHQLQILYFALTQKELTIKL